MRAADEVLIVIDDTVLGLTALDLFLSYAKALVVGPERISFVVNGYSGSLLAVPQIEAELEPVHHLGSRPWRLPPVPVDPKASLWPGSGRTLYSLGQKATRSALEQVASELGLIVAGASAGASAEAPAEVSVFSEFSAEFVLFSVTGMSLVEPFCKDVLAVQLIVGKKPARACGIFC